MAMWCSHRCCKNLCHLLGGPSSHKIPARPTLSLLKTLGLRTCGLGSKVLVPEAGRRKCRPNSYWKQDYVLGRREDPEPQVCSKSLPSLSAACIHFFFFPPNFCWMKVWLYTLMPLASLVWAETAVTNCTGVLVSTWHNNDGDYGMSSSISNNIG